MLGLIMSDHRVELDYLAARPDVDAQNLGVTGVSMGGTHAVWLTAIEPRLKAAVGVDVAPIYAPRIGIYHHGQCDLMAGAYNVADMGMIQSLCAPRALMTIYPDTNHQSAFPESAAPSHPAEIARRHRAHRRRDWAVTCPFSRGTERDIPRTSRRGFRQPHSFSARAASR